MKFCENCGTQLEDNAEFCEECGAKQEPVQQVPDEPSIPKIEEKGHPQKLSATCTPAKKQIASWLLILLLIVCSPLILFEIIWALPDYLFWILYVGIPIVVLITMWNKRSWKVWIKILLTVAYIVMFFI